MLIASMFAFNWHRFTKPTVIVGLVLIVLGMALLIGGNKLSMAIRKSAESKEKKVKDWSLVFKLTAALLVVAGSLTAIFTA